MSTYRILRISYHVRCRNASSTRFVTTVQPPSIAPWSICTRYYASNTHPSNKINGLWQSLVRRWEWSVPVGVGVSLLAILQWRYLRRHPYPTDAAQLKGPVHDVMVRCYCSLPLRIISRVWGWVASIQLPVPLRSSVYGFYAKAFDADLQEIDLDLTSFPALVDFFVRPLKQGARPIANDCNIVSPSDGKVLHFGTVTSCRVEQVKGMTYNLQHFLGDTNGLQVNKSIPMKQSDCDDYVRSLLKNPSNQLYQLTVYLAPGDYHRFHSPTDWRIYFRRHFQGKLLSVNPRIASWLPDLFSLNERVVYIGEWSGGFMAYTAVGATNVGSIKVYCDRDLVTNTKKWPRYKHFEDANLDCATISKGELFGEFRMGSTIVLLFEAPKDFRFCLKSGQSIKVGQPLSESCIKPRERMQGQMS
ncbi:phosphatidylserine decarboxylase proenzyme, mitochondrial [Cephus cinctus]|uniref:Phosphatidylserine decarboxylase proenzyme, mitochondrial n=1 Tax=Cephus cinctus TaxID=211228 RepID=A0AAJ7BM66_CEPCN|nr:phosphatidylserine decarboxylase proenzyme, mitochondrial [Cephus cinctus]